MTEIVKKAWAGTLESSDAYVEVEPAQDLTIELQSVVILNILLDLHQQERHHLINKFRF